jgi:hypothetical protein
MPKFIYLNLDQFDILYDQCHSFYSKIEHQLPSIFSSIKFIKNHLLAKFK